MSKRFTVDKQELAFRQDIATVAYNSAFQLNAIDDGSAAILTFQYDRVQDAFPAFADLIDKGWSIPAGMEHTYVTVTPAIPGHSLSAFVEVNLVKPVAKREEDLRIIHKTVEEKYKAELQLQREQEIDRVVEQQLQAERRNALAKQSQKEADDRQRIRDEVSAAIAGGK